MPLKNATLFAGIIFAFALRLYLAGLGYNYDIESFERVAKIVVSGQSVYAETARYNYGILWAYQLAALSYLQNYLNPATDTAANIQAFHLWVAAYVSLAELLLAFGIARYSNPKSWKLVLMAWLFNPLSCLLLGYHSAFDIWAILWAYLALQQLRQSVAQDKSERKQQVFAAVLMAISLSTKHIFIFFPLWISFYALFAKRRDYFLSLAFPLISYGVFFLLFLPFSFDEASRIGIIKHVFSYASADGIAFWPYVLRALSPDAAAFFSSYWKYFFILSLVFVGFLLRKTKSVEVLFSIYLLAFVAFSSAMATQYLYIPLLGIYFLLPRQYFWLYSFWAATFLLLRSPTNLGGLDFWADFYASYARPQAFFDAFLSLYALQIALFGCFIYAIKYVKK